VLAADKHPEAQVAGFLALDLFQLAQADADPKGLTFRAHGFGGVSPGAHGGGDDIR